MSEPGGRVEALSHAREVVRRGMAQAAAELAADGLPTPPLEGSLFRPLAGLAMVPVPARVSLGTAFWHGILAVQMVHEASLLHDDIMDGSELRRGAPTAFARDGLARALVAGDHLLTASYRAAVRTGSPRFLERFIYGVERTVAGERAQGRLMGEWLHEKHYREVVTAKSGELFGCVTGLSACVHGGVPEKEAYQVGRRLGRFYQMIDDFVDYCPGAASGKPPLQDFRQRKWTWVLAQVPGKSFPPEPEALLDLLFGPAGRRAPSVMRRCFNRLEVEARDLAAECARLVPGDDIVPALLECWLGVAGTALHGEEERRYARSTDGRFAVQMATPVPTECIGTAPARAADERIHALVRAGTVPADLVLAAREEEEAVAGEGALSPGRGSAAPSPRDAPDAVVPPAASSATARDAAVAVAHDSTTPVARDAGSAVARDGGTVGTGDARTAVTGDARTAVVREAMALGGPLRWMEYFGTNSRSFRFAARFFPEEPRQRVAGVYAFCRFTDDLVDRRPDLSVDVLEARLDAWEELARSAHEGVSTGVPLLDVVMADSADAGVPFRYAAELIEGVRMDLHPRSFETLDDLYRYTYRVASVVGCWLTELFGERSPWVLERAESLGHAMQITNILRDVGEDLLAGRLYLPLDRLREQGLDRDALESLQRERGAVPDDYRRLVEGLMRVADRHYDEAFRAIPSLPDFFQRPVAVAARVYQGIHDAIRRNEYDNLGRRAYTNLPAKLRLACGALFELRRARRTHARASVLTVSRCHAEEGAGA